MKSPFLLIFLAMAAPLALAAGEGEVRIKELARLASAQENALVGYGIVTGLAGTGDSSRSAGTVQSIANLLRRFDVNVEAAQLRSRNAAGVMVTATLPPFSRRGDKIDINVTSLGDARSLLGGTLLLTHLKGPDDRIHALAQGPISVGGFKYDFNGNVVQKNHPTAGTVPGGATIERQMRTALTTQDGVIELALFDPDFTTAQRIATAINEAYGSEIALAWDASLVQVRPRLDSADDLSRFFTRTENLLVEPDGRARVVINERNGSIVSGGRVHLGAVTVSHGNLRVAITTEFLVSQPEFVARTGSGVRSVVVPNSRLEVSESMPASVSLPEGSSVTDLVTALNKVQASTRDIIAIFQAIKRAGALHAELIIQ